MKDVEDCMLADPQGWIAITERDVAEAQSAVEAARGVLDIQRERVRHFQERLIALRIALANRQATT